MKRMLTYALGAVMAASALPALAQDNFPDTQENHWAYEALARMKAAGLLVGYPDGLFRGARPASRYEMAVALHALWQHMKGLTDGLDAQQRALQAKLDTMKTDQFATKDELKQVQDALATVNAALQGMKSYGDDISALKKMSSTFEKELASMGVDLEALKKAVNDLGARMDAVEKRTMPVDIHGNMNLLMIGGSSDSPNFGITVDGRPTGVSRDGNSRPVGWTEDLTVLHEAALTLSGTNSTGPKWRSTVVIGNTLQGLGSGRGFSSNSGVAFGNQSDVFHGVPFGEAASDVWIQNLAVMFATSLFGMKFDAEIGRVGTQLNAYTFRRPDNTPYYKNPYWDDGNWNFDGGIFKFKLGCAMLMMFGGRQNDRLTTQGVELNPMFAGQAGHRWTPNGERPRGFGESNGIFINQHLGFNVNVPLSNKGKLNLNYLFLDSNNRTFLGNSMFANRAIVMGGDLEYMLSNAMTLVAGYSQSNLLDDGDTVIDEDNRALWGGVAYKANRWGARVAYRQIDPQFGAPGSWGRMGINWNPSDIQGTMASVNFDLSDRASLMVGGGWYTGRDITLNGLTGMSSDDKINHINAHLNFKVNESWDAVVGTEMVNWDLADRALANFVGGKPTERWYTFKLLYHMSDNAWLSFMLQMSKYDSDNVIGFNPFDNFGATEAQGHLFTTQLGIKF